MREQAVDHRTAPISNVTAATDPLAHTTTFAYDALNRQTQQTDARSGLTTFLYDAAGNRTALVDPDGNRTTFAYDVLNRLTLQTDPLNKNTTLAYDAAGRQTQAIDRLGRQVTFAFDAAGRETGETWLNADGSTQQRVTYGYDADNNRTAAANGAGAYTYAYDALGRQTAIQEPFGLLLTYRYDAAGNRTLVQDSKGGTTTSVYDNANRLTSAQFSGTSPAVPLRIDFSYTARDQVQTQARYADLPGNTKVGATSYVYDAVGRVQNLQHYNGANSVLANYTYAYDLASRLTGEVDNGGAPITYTYDATNQLLGDGTSTHTYDLNGNRTDPGYVTPSDNQVTNDGTWTYTYDAEGNLAKKSKGTNAETWTYGFDNRNQMLWAKDSATDGGTVLQLLTFTYDVDGHRLQKLATAGGTTTTLSFGYDGSSVWADLDGSNALVTRRLFDNADVQPVARQSAAGVAAWYLPDRQGSIRQLTDNGGVVIDALAYDGYGVVTSESMPASGDRYRYAGGQWDAETGFNLFGIRYEDPPTLRFTSQDRLGLTPDPDPYRYGKNSPTNYTDPTGTVVVAQKGSTFLQTLLSESNISYATMTLPSGGVFIDILDPLAPQKLVASKGKAVNEGWLKRVAAAGMGGGEENLEIEVNTGTLSKKTPSDADLREMIRYQNLKLLAEGRFNGYPKALVAMAFGAPAPPALRAPDRSRPSISGMTPGEQKRAEAISRRRLEQERGDAELRRLAFDAALLSGGSELSFYAMMKTADNNPGEVLGLIGGTVEVVTGALTWNPWLVALGADQVQASARSIARGEHVNTLTNTAISEFLQGAVGMEKDDAQRWANGLEIAVHVAAAKPWRAGTTPARGAAVTDEGALRNELKGLAQEAHAAMEEAANEGFRTIERGGAVLKTGTDTRGPVLTVVKDLETGKVFYGQNQGKVVDNLHPLLKDTLRKYLDAGNPDWTRAIGKAGSHSEIAALNQALWAREAASLPVKDLSSFGLYNIRTQDLARSAAGTPIPQCKACKAITEGVLDLTD